MSDTPNNTKALDTHQKESLISMIGLHFIEEFELLNEEQLDQAKSSLQALFLQSTGEETMLHKLINILRNKKALNQTFNDMVLVLTAIAKSADIIDKKTNKLKQTLKSIKITAEENKNFTEPFLRFSYQFSKKVRSFQRHMLHYRDTRENEARLANMYHVANEARERLKKRLSGELAMDPAGEIEHQIKEKVLASFNYEEIEINYQYAKKQSETNQREIVQLLQEFKEMCQQAMNPQMRDNAALLPTFRQSNYDDVFNLFSHALQKYPRLEQIKPEVLELFRLYQHSYGMFNLDFQRFNKAIEPMLNDTEDYFRAKDEDEDIQAKRNKLEKIEGLIAFLERSAALLNDNDDFTYIAFSSKISDIITTSTAGWKHISEDLLRMKVSAEAEYSTQLV